MREIIQILKEKAVKVGYISHVGGLVETVERFDDDRLRRIPAYQDGNLYVPLIPSSNDTAMLFFRQIGDLRRSPGRFAFFTGRVRVVLWVNTDKINGDVPLGELQKALTIKRPIEANGISRLKTKADAIQSDRDAAGEFGGFDLSEQETRFLMPPFKVYSFDLAVSVVYSGCGVNPSTSTNKC